MKDILPIEDKIHEALHPRETFSFGFSSNSQMSLDNWSEFSAEKQNVDDLKSVILSRVQTVNASVDASLDNPRPPFHRFVQSALEQTENLLDEKYAELFGDRSEISMDVL